MSRIFSDVTATIGGTPLVRLDRIAGGLPAAVLAKLEFRNPVGSVKDRIGLAMIRPKSAWPALILGRFSTAPPVVTVTTVPGMTSLAISPNAPPREYQSPPMGPEEMVRVLSAARPVPRRHRVMITASPITQRILNFIVASLIISPSGNM